ncbi:hypothetical protein KEJ27_06520 [Candidatus Bathyarchaeota archaeon]|nr:hypothetical protein [Candidatus Bathyarchaeota archaeon]MBS7612763.1 hypothetical protein [Candidatus Bathyarchaeota archaeon]MBS7618323.1 hypothetical protein [Candidatus Bathyarchaeota archaeon]
MLKWMVSFGLVLLTVGTLLFIASLTLETQLKTLESEASVYEDRFEMNREGAKLLKFTFPGNVTIIASIGANMCVGLKIYSGEAFEALFKTVEELNVEDYPSIVTLMENISKPISWSHQEYYRHIIQNNETSTYYFLIYNYPSCYPKTVNLEIGYVIGSFEKPKEERLTLKNQMLSAGLATTVIGFLTLMYGLAKEPKK